MTRKGGIYVLTYVLTAVMIVCVILMYRLRGLMLTPIPLGESCSVTAVLEVAGSSPELEQTVEALLWLDRNGTLPMRIIISDAGMDDETRRVAELLSRKDQVQVTDNR